MGAYHRNIQDLNISDLIYGIYILEIVFDDNRLTNMKIMKY